MLKKKKKNQETNGSLSFIKTTVELSSARLFVVLFDANIFWFGFHHEWFRRRMLRQVKPDSDYFSFYS